MKFSPILSVCLAVCITASTNATLIISGVVDGPRSGGTPKAIELYACEDIPDLSIYNIETPNNGAAATGAEYALSGSMLAGEYLYVASESTQFTTYFGFAPDLVNNVANINGDDNVILYENTVMVDQFGVNGQDGTGQAWEYDDSFAYRISFTGPNPLFNISEWTFGGVDYLNSQTSSGVNGSDGKTVPFGTFEQICIPEPTSIALMFVSLGTILIRRK
jgi:predicted extracellular nuclease